MDAPERVEGWREGPMRNAARWTIASRGVPNTTGAILVVDTAGCRRGRHFEAYSRVLEVVEEDFLICFFQIRAFSNPSGKKPRQSAPLMRFYGTIAAYGFCYARFPSFIIKKKLAGTKSVWVIIQV